MKERRLLERPRRHRNWGEPNSSPENDESSGTNQDRDDCADDSQAHEGFLFELGLKNVQFELSPYV
jgi:hypothetical protein